ARTGRAGAAVRRHDRRRLSRPGRRAPRRSDHAGADRRRGRGLDRAAQRRRPRRARARAPRVREVRVIVTRPRAQAKPLVEALERAAVDVVECPLIEIARTSDEPIDAAGYDWLIVTSPNGAEELVRRGR